MSSSAPALLPRGSMAFPDRASHVVQSRFAEHPHFVFSLDEGGSERYIHYRFDLEHGTYEPLTDLPTRSYVGGVDGEGRRVIYPSTRRNGKDFDLYVVDVTNPASNTMVLEAEGEYSPLAVSPDGRSALVVRFMSHIPSRAYLLDSIRARCARCSMAPRWASLMRNGAATGRQSILRPTFENGTIAEVWDATDE